MPRKRTSVGDIFIPADPNRHPRHGSWKKYHEFTPKEQKLIKAFCRNDEEDMRTGWFQIKDGSVSQYGGSLRLL